MSGIEALMIPLLIPTLYITAYFAQLEFLVVFLLAVARFARPGYLFIELLGRIGGGLIVGYVYVFFAGVALGITGVEAYMYTLQVTVAQKLPRSPWTLYIFLFPVAFKRQGEVEVVPISFQGVRVRTFFISFPPKKKA